MSAQFVVPRMPEGCYLGGMAALNLPSPEGTGDWHLEQTFFRARTRLSRSFVSGTGCATDTNWIFGLEGIYECTKILDSLSILYEASPVYAASHSRATVDLVLDATLASRSPDFVVLDDWMPRYSDKLKVYAMLKKAYSYLSMQQLAVLHLWEKKHILELSR